jgi:cellulose synthase/poly-beta-1,6-N-acetylglucosamine synthase-like glycosyltransferase
VDADSADAPVLEPYALLVSVYNLGPATAAFVEAMRPHLARLWVIDDASTDDTADRLERAGVRCIRGEINRHKPGAIRQLLTRLPAEIRTVVVLDPDGVIQAPDGDRVAALERVLLEFQVSGMAACCPRVAVRTRDVWERLQALEYCLSFSLGRKSLADQCIPSGFAVYRRDALSRVLEAHSLSVYAEDLENALILTHHGERSYYDGRLVVETDGKRDWPSLFSQRVGWHFGLLRVYAAHRRRIARWAATMRPLIIYQHVVYVVLLGLLLHPLRVFCLLVLLASALNGLDNLLDASLIPDVTATDSWRLPVAWLAYTVLTLLYLHLTVTRAERRRVFAIVPIYFLYVLALVVPITIGYLNWVCVNLVGRRLYRDHFK